MPQRPQFCALVRVSTQVPLHEVCPAGQPPPPMHAPPTQLCPEAQALPQAPQCAVLVVTSTQAPPHDMRGAAHAGEVTQAPALHALPPGQARPHIPQFALSVRRFAQRPLQSNSGGVHEVAPPVSVAGLTTSGPVVEPASSLSGGMNTPPPARAAQPIIAARATHRSKLIPTCVISAPRYRPHGRAANIPADPIAFTAEVKRGDGGHNVSRSPGHLPRLA
jgi:hypothetical protein